MIPFIFSFLIKTNFYHPIVNFMNINNILISNHSKNNICITNVLPLSSSPLLINFNSFSQYDEYNYSSSFLFLNKNEFHINYNFYDDLNNFYNYSFLINSYKINNNKYKFNVSVNYNNHFINKDIYEKLIKKQIKKCFFLNQNKIIHPILKNYLD